MVSKKGDLVVKNDKLFSLIINHQLAKLTRDGGLIFSGSFACFRTSTFTATLLVMFVGGYLPSQMENLYRARRLIDVVICSAYVILTSPDVECLKASEHRTWENARFHRTQLFHFGTSSEAIPKGKELSSKLDGHFRSGVCKN